MIQSAKASRREMGKPRGRTRPAVRPAWVKWAANSSEMRSCPPVITSMLTSIPLIESRALPVGTKVTAVRIRPLGAIARGHAALADSAAVADRSGVRSTASIGMRLLLAEKLSADNLVRTGPCRLQQHGQRKAPLLCLPCQMAEIACRIANMLKPFQQAQDSYGGFAPSHRRARL